MILSIRITWFKTSLITHELILQFNSLIHNNEQLIRLAGNQCIMTYLWFVCHTKLLYTSEDLEYIACVVWIIFMILLWCIFVLFKAWQHLASFAFIQLLKKIIFCAPQKKESHTDLELHEFWTTIPLRLTSHQSS